MRAAGRRSHNGQMTDQSGVTWGVVLPHGAAGEFAAVSPQVAWARLRDSAIACDQLGYDHVWISDHLMASFGRRTGQQFEAYSTLAALTQVTQRTRLGVIVTCAQYRSVAMLAKQAAGIDVMSDGRLIFALGAGWDEGEFRAFGYPFPSAGDRVSAFGRDPPGGARALVAAHRGLRGSARAARRSVLQSRGPHGGHRCGRVPTGGADCGSPPNTQMSPTGTSGLPTSVASATS